MKKRIIKQGMVFILLHAMISFTGIHAQVKPGVFYSVTGNGMKDTSWLFGTYHLINGSYLNETPAVLSAFNRSGHLIVEIITDSSQLQSANAKALLQNKQLSSLLGKGFADTLDAELKANFGQGIAQFEAVKPMSLMLTLSLINLIRDNQAVLKKYTGAPLDAFFVEKSRSAGKKVTALETIGQQMDLLFNHLSDEEQATMLMQFLRNKEQNTRLGNELLTVYFENDIARIYGLYEQSIKVTGDMNFLVKDRNDQWMEKLPPLFNEQSTFVAVGALHLAGPDGLVAQLRKMGYSVTAQNLK